MFSRLDIRCALPTALRGVLAIALVALAGAVSAEQFTEGTHYKRLSPPITTEAPQGKIEVREFFWYGCPHCYSLESHITRWKNRASKSVHFVQTPAILGASWVSHAYTYYTLVEMGMLDQLHKAFFDALHKDKLRLASPEKIADFFGTQNGLDKSRFIGTFQSASVNSHVKKAERLATQYQVRGVPFVVVNGRLVILLESLTSYDQMIRLLDHLVAIELATLKTKKGKPTS